jgi:hypothetical protein
MARRLVQAYAALGVLCAVAVATPPPALAAPGWTDPIDVAEGNHSADDSAEVAMDAKGDTMLVWAQSNGANTVIEADWRPAGGAFGTPVTLSLPSVNSYNPTVAMDPQGDVTVAWLSFFDAHKVVDIAWRPAGGVFSSTSAKPLINEESEPPVVAMDSLGDTTVAWVVYNGGYGVVEAASRPAGGTFGKPVELSTSGLNATVPAIAMDPRGDTTIAWILNNSIPKPEPPYLTQVATQDAGASFGAPTEFHLNHDYYPSVAMDSRGDTTVVWGRYEEAHELETTEVSTRTAGSESFEEPVVIYSKPSSEVEARTTQYKVAMDGAGDTTIAWASHFSGMRVSTRPAGGSFSEAIVLSSPNLVAEQAAVAMDEQGDSVVAWAGAGEAGHFPLGSTKPAGGAFSTPVFLSSTGDLASPEIGLISPVSVAIDAQGDAVSAWMSSNGTRDVFQVAGYQATGPELEALEAPAEGQTDTALAFSVSPLSLWSTIASTTWSWGDGSTNTSGTSVTHAFNAPGAYHVSVSATDAFGNLTNATRTITIQASPAIHVNPKTTLIPPKSKPKAREAVVSAFTPLFVTKAEIGGSTLGLFVGIASVGGARPGDTIVVRCIAGCQRPLHEIVHVRKHHHSHRTISISPPLLVYRTTRIEIDLLAHGRVARFVQYHFVRTGNTLIAHPTHKGCLSSTRRPRSCP